MYNSRDSLKEETLILYGLHMSYFLLPVKTGINVKSNDVQISLWLGFPLRLLMDSIQSKWEQDSSFFTQITMPSVTIAVNFRAPTQCEKLCYSLYVQSYLILT